MSTTVNAPLQHTQVITVQSPLPPPDHYSNSLNIINQHDSLLSLLNAVYPSSTPPVVSRPEHIVNSSSHHKRSYLCLYPHCDRLFHSLGSLRFHISKSHIVDNQQVLKSELANPIAMTAALSLSMSQKRQPEPPKRRGRPPKNVSAVPYSGIIDTGAASNPIKPQLIVPYRQINPHEKTWANGQLLTFKHYPTTHHHF